MTDRRLVFSPNVFDRLLRAKVWSCLHADVDSVDTVDRNARDLASGGARRRLGVHLENGTDELFVVNHADELAARITEIVRPDTP